MSEPSTERSVTLERLAKGSYRATNKRGDTLVVGEGDDGNFTPVELLLTAMAACTAIDVDYIVGKRAEPTSCRVRISGHKVRDEGGNHMTGLRLTFDVQFPEGAPGDAARGVLQRAIEQTRDRLCTVSRTVQLGADVEYVRAD